jgi:hypothetical protein
MVTDLLPSCRGGSVAEQLAAANPRADDRKRTDRRGSPSDNRGDEFQIKYGRRHTVSCGV